MRTELEPTGERMIEGAYFDSREAYAIYVMHAASYAFAERFCAQRRVLDLGCGSGYGVGRVASVATRVTGVDVSGEAIAFARAAYLRENVSFEVIDPDAPLPFSDASFDVILSFQVIEHVVDELHYLREARRVLVDGGVLVVITPDRTHRLLPRQRPWNRWHLREYSPESLSSLVARVFEVREVLRMGAPEAVAGIELRRYRWTKWLTLPFTWPGIPEVLRRRGLDLLHALRPTPKAVAAEVRRPPEGFGFDESAMVIAADAPNSLNLVVVATVGRALG